MRAMQHTKNEHIIKTDQIVQENATTHFLINNYTSPYL